MTTHIEYLKDVLGNNYIGVNIQFDTVLPYLYKLKRILGDGYDEYIKYKSNRDHGKHHITVINVAEYNKLSHENTDKFINSLENVFDTEITDIKFIGIGKAQKNENITYYVVVRSNILNEVRKVYDLGEIDFHITLGFKFKDVFGVRKNEVLKETDPFLKLLKSEYYKSNESFDFVWEIENFEGCDNIEPVKINDTSITFRSGEFNYFTVGLIDDKLWVVAKWGDDKKMPILSYTIISRIFKDI
jgi:hypothetical protein